MGWFFYNCRIWRKSSREKKGEKKEKRGVVSCKKNGKGTLTHPSGEKYSGDFKDDKKHGKGYYINPNGMNYDGGYKNDMFHGKGKFIDTTGKVIEGTFKEGKIIK